MILCFWQNKLFCSVLLTFRDKFRLRAKTQTAVWQSVFWSKVIWYYKNCIGHFVKNQYCQQLPKRLSCCTCLQIIINQKLVFPCKFLCSVITHNFALILLNNACYSTHINPYLVIAFFLALIKHKLKSEMQMTFGYSVCIFGIAVTRSSHITDYIACTNLVALL